VRFQMSPGIFSAFPLARRRTRFLDGVQSKKAKIN
jgi:hypothetical protein